MVTNVTWNDDGPWIQVFFFFFFVTGHHLRMGVTIMILLVVWVTRGRTRSDC